VNRFPVFEKNHPQIAILGLENLRPALDATVSLDDFFDWGTDGPFDPFVEDCCSVRALPKRITVASCLHGFAMAPLLQPNALLNGRPPTEWPRTDAARDASRTVPTCS